MQKSPSQCRGSGESVGRTQGGARWQNRGKCRACGKDLALTSGGRIPRHVPAKPSAPTEPKLPPFGLDDLVSLASKFADDADFGSMGGIGIDRIVGALPEIRALLKLAETVRQHRDGEGFVSATDGFTAFNTYETLRKEALRRVQIAREKTNG